MISSDDCVDLFEQYSEGELPYMRCIELTKYTPQHFKLDKWHSPFRIPDFWMKKIYKNERYKDTDEEQSFCEPEQLSKEQKTVLYDYIKKRRRQDEAYVLPSGSRGSRRLPPDDRFTDILKQGIGEKLLPRSDKGRESLDSDVSVIDEPTSPSPPLKEIKTEPNLALCCKHHVQPEERIVDIALLKMRNLKPEEEKKYRELLKDKEFMQILDKHVDAYCRAQ